MRGHAVSLDTPRLPFTGATDSTRMASQMAAERAGTRAETDRGRIYSYLLGFFRGSGATDKEMQLHLHMDGSTQRPRRIELLRAGLIQDAGYKRNGCTVWIAPRV